MRELRFDGLSEDGSRLVLAGKDGQKYRVVIDERLEAAVRRDRARIGQVEIEQSGALRPREIQARIRAGATAADVAAASGLSVEHVRRFEGPVLTERAWVAHQAQATEVRRPGGDIELGDLVADRLDPQGVDPTDISWDAWRRDDGLWVVIATFPLGPNTHVATWTYDSASRTMTVADENARSLSAIDSHAPLRLTSTRPTLTSVVLVDDAPDLATDEAGDRPVPSRTGESWAADAGFEDAGDVAGSEDAGFEDSLPVDGAAEDAGGPDAAGAGAADALAGQVGSSDAEDDAALERVASDPAAATGAGESGRAAGRGTTPQGTGSEATAPESTAPRPEPVGAAPADEAGAREPADATARGKRPAAPRSTGKRTVPSFDDILFGPGPKR